MGVNKGDVLIIPAPNNNHKNDDNKMTIRWQQSLRSRVGDYYVLVAKNKSQGNAEVPFFIQSEWYNEQGFNTASSMRRVDDDNYELTMDDRHQYGMEGQFIVWHDKDRKPYAERFLEKGFFANGTKTALRVIRLLTGNESPIAQVAQQLEALGRIYVGNPLKTF
ncbi:hypothetical protein FRC04_005019 [Tulasnella sp. 424]|nr:hypothetical protein FRC04_005019 [Tulasnella sp. 424]KAG8963366.1 hypothetical protein FRC05_004754 [Tulasnella sp. 425]